MIQHATTAQVLDAFAKQDDRQMLALKQAAHRYLGGTHFSDPLDLIHEALYLTLEGRRNWPLHVDFGLYLAMTMRSVADTSRRSSAMKTTSAVPFDEMTEEHFQSENNTPSVEDQLIAMEQFSCAQAAADSVRSALSDDPKALRVLNGLLAGMGPKEMCLEFQISSKDFNAAHQRVMRRLRNSGRLQ